ncbi:MAG: WD40/YVTN/BNR-like repeat-containing protein [Terriglobales bacterium]
MRRLVMSKTHGVLLVSSLALALTLTFCSHNNTPAIVASAPSTGQNVQRLTSALKWRSVGPYDGGRVTTVAGIASQPAVFFLGAAGGGVWKTIDAGHRWNFISQSFKNNNIGAMAVAPSNPNIIYVGTGDSAPRNTVLTGEGMYKSTDGGKTWSFIGLPQTHIIGWIVISPTNPNLVYVAALGHLFGPNPDRGVFKTTDGGKTWKKVLFVNDHTGAITLAMDPANPQIVYAGMWQMTRRHWTFSSGGPGSGLYKTTNGGASWTNISHRPGLPTGIFGKVGVAVAPSNPSVVYALIQADYDGQAGGLFRSNNAGQTWKMVNNSMDITQRAFYYGRVYVDPKDANTIYLPNVGAWVSHDGGKTIQSFRVNGGDNHTFWINPVNPNIMIEGNDGGATVTEDGGKVWSSENTQPTGQFYHADLDNQFPFHIYGAQQDSGSWNGSSASPAAVWASVRGGEMSWVVPTPGKPWITYGSGYYGQEWQDNRRTHLITNVSPWPAYKFGLMGSKIKYRFGWNHHAATFIPGTNTLLLGANVLLETKDGGTNWKAISPDLTRNDKTRLGRPGGPISADVTGEEMFDTISSIGVSPLDHSVIWVGSDDGLVHLTTNGGGNWSEVRPPALPTWSTITCVEPSPTTKGTAYLSASRYDWDDFHPYVYKTTDYGKTWTPITTGLPDGEYVESVRQDPSDPWLLIAGTSASAYVSLNNGQQWRPLTLNLPAVRVNDVEFQPQQHAVVLATFGRAFWVLDNLQFLEQIATAKAPRGSRAGALGAPGAAERQAGRLAQPGGVPRPSIDAAFLFKPQQTWLYTAGGGGFGGGGAAGARKPYGLTVFFNLPSNYTSAKPVKLSFSDASGKLIRTYTFPLTTTSRSFFTGKEVKKTVNLKPGMNRYQWNLRYPKATDVTGIFNSGFAAGVPNGPQVVPGAYEVTLTYGTTTQKQPFAVTLDPNLHTTQAQLQQRFALLMQIHDALNQLDTNLNKAIAARTALQKAGNHSAALAALNTDIDNLVDLRIQSGEGALVYPGRLRGWLTSIAGQISTAFVPPTPAMVTVANQYIAQAHTGVSRLQAGVNAAQQALRN